MVQAEEEGAEQPSRSKPRRYPSAWSGKLIPERSRLRERQLL